MVRGAPCPSPACLRFPSHRPGTWAAPSPPHPVGPLPFPAVLWGSHWAWDEGNQPIWGAELRLPWNSGTDCRTLFPCGLGSGWEYGGSPGAWRGGRVTCVPGFPDPALQVRPPHCDSPHGGGLHHRTRFMLMCGAGGEMGQGPSLIRIDTAFGAWLQPRISLHCMPASCHRANQTWRSMSTRM